MLATQMAGLFTFKRPRLPEHYPSDTQSSTSEEKEEEKEHDPEVSLSSPPSVSDGSDDVLLEGALYFKEHISKQLHTC